MKEVYSPLINVLEQQSFFRQIGHPEKLEIKRSSRRKTMELQAFGSNRSNASSGWKVELRVPTGASLQDIQNFLLDKKSWLARQGQKFSQLSTIYKSMPVDIRKLLQNRRMAIGQPMLFLGQSFYLQKHLPLSLGDKSIRLTPQPPHAKQLSFPCPLTDNLNQNIARLNDLESKYLEKALRQAALEFLQSRCEVLGQKVAVRPVAVKIRKYKARWGCCTANKELIFNWQLIFAPLGIVDYVVAHELIHLVEFNHSKKFWQQLEQLLPNYELHQQWLRYCGHFLLRF